MSTTVRHALFWATVYILWTFMKSSGGEHFGVFMMVNMVNVPIYMAAFYFLKHIQIPNLYDRNRIILFVISLIASSFCLYTIWRLACIFWLYDLRAPQHEAGYFDNIPFMQFDRYLMHAIQFYSPGVLLLAWEMYEERRNEKDRIRELEKQKIDTELKFLKAQLNPHFLFNTFNNLYSLVINGDPNAPKMILQLSSILEYLLYTSQKKKVALREEIEIVEKYIALEKIRYGERLYVNLQTTGDYSYMLSPLLVLSLVENAFKHGASKDIGNPKIKIDLNISDKIMKLSIWNSKSHYNGESKDIHKKGIGLTNVRRQLELQYPNKHSIEIQDQENSYEVILKVTNEKE